MNARRERRATSPPASPQEALARIVAALERIADALDGAPCRPPRTAAAPDEMPSWIGDLLRAAAGRR